MTDEWTQTTLGEVAEVVGGGTPSTKVPEFWDGDVVWVGPTEIVRQDGRRICDSDRRLTEEGLARSSAKLLPAGTVLVTSRASVGFTAIADVPLATNQGFQSLIPGPAVTSEFLMFWVQAHRDLFRSRAGGSTFPEISKANVGTIPITVPPLVVQRRIVDLMEHLDTHLANLETEREAVLHRHDALAEHLLDGYPEVAVGELAIRGNGLVGGPFGSDLSRKHYASTGVPVIRGTNMPTPSEGRYINGEFVFVSEEKADSLSRNIALAGDVVFTQRGTLGQVGLVPPGTPRFVVSQSQMRLRVDPSKASNEWVYFQFARPSMVATIKSRNTATANPHINLGILWPSPRSV